MQPLIGVPTVLEAARMLSKKPDIVFEIVGGNKRMKQAVRQAIADGANISYSPWLTLEELEVVMQRSSLMLGGPFGDTRQAQNVVTTKTYQALASNIPVVVGDSLATREFFRDKDTALITPQADPEALVRAISWASKHPKELKTIAANGLKLYDRQFSTDAIAKILQPLTDEAS